METKFKSMGKACGETLFKTLIFLFFSTFLFSSPVMAQSDEPSIKNISKTLDAAKEMQRKETMSYVFMVLGFSVVIAIAWFTNARAQKRKKSVLESTIHHHHHGSGHKHDAQRRMAHRVKR